MINALNSSIDIGGAKYIYCIADIFGIIVAGGVHVLLSKMFPDRDSLIEHQILAVDVLEGRVPEYYHLSMEGRQREGSMPDTEIEEKKVSGATVAEV
ncbi:hypothetical protein P7C70_g702, partial [Phenoliferia sp. Uapishka_3]